MQNAMWQRWTQGIVCWGGLVGLMLEGVMHFDLNAAILETWNAQHTPLM
jgi:hypothetical protein